MKKPALWRAKETKMKPDQSSENSMAALALVAPLALIGVCLVVLFLALF